jgi:hypothetical protein
VEQNLPLDDQLYCKNVESPKLILPKVEFKFDLPSVKMRKTSCGGETVTASINCSIPKNEDFNLKE